MNKLFLIIAGIVILQSCAFVYRAPNPNYREENFIH